MFSDASWYMSFLHLIWTSKLSLDPYKHTQDPKKPWDKIENIHLEGLK